MVDCVPVDVSTAAGRHSSDMNADDTCRHKTDAEMTSRDETTSCDAVTSRETSRDVTASHDETTLHDEATSSTLSSSESSSPAADVRYSLYAVSVGDSLLIP